MFFGPRKGQTWQPCSTIESLRRQSICCWAICYVYPFNPWRNPLWEVQDKDPFTVATFAVLVYVSVSQSTFPASQQQEPVLKTFSSHFTRSLCKVQSELGPNENFLRIGFRALQIYCPFIPHRHSWPYQASFVWSRFQAASNVQAKLETSVSAKKRCCLLPAHCCRV